MTLAENVIENIKNIGLNTSWGYKDNFYSFLQKNEYFVLPTFSIKNIDDMKDEIIFEYDDTKVICILEWRNSSMNNGVVVSNVTIN